MIRNISGHLDINAVSLKVEGKFVETSSDLNKLVEGKSATISSHLVRKITFY